MAKQPAKTVAFLGDGAAPVAAAFDTVAGRMGLPWRAVRVADATAIDPAAARVVLFGPADLPAEFAGRSEPWPLPSGAEPAAVEREVNALVARLLGGGGNAPPPAARPAPKPAKPAHTAKVGRETKGRRGKGVVTVSGLPLGEAGLRDLAAKLKTACGTGGTVKDGVIEIQGDQRDRVAAELEKLGYAVKRVGG